ncbi:MAG: GNAT family N-acetyltransferase [Crocinitomicaceae bacterium]
MRLLARKNINDAVWNRIVENSPIENCILYSWAMDATAENWCAVVDGEYDFFLPIPFSVKLGVKRARQQVYSRQVDFIGDSKLFPKAIEILKTEFKEFDVRFSETKFGISDQYFQILDLTKEIDYSTNAKRLIKKAKHFRYELTPDLAPLIELYTSNTHKKLNNSNAYLQRLKRLMQSCMENGKGYAFTALDGDKIVGACFIIEDKSTSTYLIGDADLDEKKAGVVYGMIDFAINTAKERNMKHFDFGGSNVASVAQFYRKFGSENKKYTRVNWDKSPFWFKALKKIKG